MKVKELGFGPVIALYRNMYMGSGGDDRLFLYFGII